MAWLAIWFGISNTCGGVWLNGTGQNRETNEEHDEDCSLLNDASLDIAGDEDSF